MGTRMAEEFDLRSHMGTYGGFTKLLTYGAVGIIIVLILLGIFVA
jgi:aa3 type cytochrome c oxidase subunit IV